MAKAKVDEFSKEALENLVKKCNSYRQLSDLLGYGTRGGFTYKTIKDRVESYNISTAHFGSRAGYIKRSPENIFIKNSNATQKVLREWYKKGNYSTYECSICKLPPMWQNKELTLTLDHINGDNRDDRLENLRWVCPNCDRQLPTFSRKKHTTNDK
jgi:hypothetical protein